MRSALAWGRNTEFTSKTISGSFLSTAVNADLNYIQELEIRSLSLIEGNESNLTVTHLTDFNLPNIDWSAPSPSSLFTDSVSSHFCDMIDDNLNKMIKIPTRRGNTLDLVFKNIPELLIDIKVCAGLANSDHDSIELLYKIGI